MSVLIEAVHTVRPATNAVFERWVDNYAHVSVPAMERSGFEILGAWKRTTGPVGEDVLLLRFAGLGEFERASRALMTDRGLGAGIGDGITVAESLKAAVRVPYATAQRLDRTLAEQPSAPRRYLQSVLHLAPGGGPKAYELIGTLADRAEAAGTSRLVTAYQTMIGDRSELTNIWVLEGDPQGREDLAGDRFEDVLGPLRAVAPEEAISHLIPLPYSRLG